MWKDFKNFISRGNVVDMAVGVIIGGAFGSIVSSLVNDIIMPVIGKITSGIDLKAMKFVLTEAVMDGATVVKPEVAITYGAFIQNIVNFFIIAASIFVMIKCIEKLQKKQEPAPEPPKGPTTEELLTEIRDLMKK